MKGERIAILRRIQTGEDAHGEPVYSWSAELVNDCLVRPLSGQDVANKTEREAYEVHYIVALPKVYTATMKPLAHARIAFVERGQSQEEPDQARKVVGCPDITRPCPTRWNTLVEVT